MITRDGLKLWACPKCNVVYSQDGKCTACEPEAPLELLGTVQMATLTGQAPGV